MCHICLLCTNISLLEYSKLTDQNKVLGILMNLQGSQCPLTCFHAFLHSTPALTYRSSGGGKCLFK